MDHEERVPCVECGSLLAIRNRGAVRFKLREMHYIVSGRDLRTTTVCRKCHRLNEF